MNLPPITKHIGEEEFASYENLARMPQDAPEAERRTPASEAERRTPASVDAERSILGAILLDDSHIQEAQQGLDVADFFLASHRVIYSHMVGLTASGRACDIITLAQELTRSKKLEASGGVAYLASLTEGLPRRLSIAEYVRIVADKSLLRQVLVAAEEAARQASDGTFRAPDLIHGLTKRLVGMAARSKTVWRIKNNREVLVDGLEFATKAGKEVDWAVEGIIQRGGNGLVLADPGAGKSLTMIDLALHLISGTTWMSCPVPRRMRVGIVSREDYPGETARRIASLLQGTHLDSYDLDGWLYVNTRAQTPSFNLNNENDVQEIIEALQEKQIEFVIFDVFRRLWDGNENDNAEVSTVLAALTRIQTQAGCALALVHHLNKSEGGTVFHRSRGSSAIEGWREWAFGLTMDQHETRKLEFYTKASHAHRPIYFQVENQNSALRLMQTDAPEPAVKKRAVEQVLQNGKQKARLQPKQQSMTMEQDAQPNYRDMG